MDTQYATPQKAPRAAAIAKSTKMLILAVLLSLSAVFGLVSMFSFSGIYLVIQLIVVAMQIILCAGAWLVYLSLNPTGATMMLIVQRIKHIVALVGVILTMIGIIAAIILMAVAEIGFGSILLVTLALLLSCVYMFITWKYLKWTCGVIKDAGDQLRGGADSGSRFAARLAVFALILGILALLKFILQLIISGVALGSIESLLRELGMDRSDASDLTSSLLGLSFASIVKSIIQPLTYIMVYSLASDMK